MIFVFIDGFYSGETLPELDFRIDTETLLNPSLSVFQLHVDRLLLFFRSFHLV